jgi:hypothetical protein
MNPVAARQQAGVDANEPVLIAARRAAPLALRRDSGLDTIRLASAEDTLRPERLGLKSVEDASLERMRGGLRVNGLNLSIGLQIKTLVEGQIALVSQLWMTDSGRWIASRTHTEHLPSNPAASSSSVAAASSPVVVSVGTVPVDGVAAAPPAGAAAGATNAHGVGTGNFEAIAGDPQTTQIIHRLVGNDITSVIANRVDNRRIDQSMTVNVGVNNLHQFSARFASITRLNRFGRDMARLSIR